MAAGRFFRRNRYAEFQPFTLEQYSTVPIAWQAAHDQSVAGAEALRQYVQQNLPQDEEAARQIEAKLNEDIDSVVKEINDYGFNPTITGRIYKTKQERDRLFNPGGDAYRIQSNAAKYQKYLEEIQNNKDLTQDQKNKARMVSLGRYKGFREGDFNGFTPSAYVDVDKAMLDIADEIEPQVIERDTGWGLSADGTWRNRVDGRTSIGTPEQVRDYLISYASQTGHPAVSYLRDAAIMDEELGLAQYSQDENGITFNGQVHNPSNFNYANEFVNRELMRSASRTGAVKARDKVSTRHLMSNASEFTLGRAGLLGGLTDNMNLGPGQELDSEFTRLKNMTTKIVDSEGNMVQPDQIKSALLQSIQASAMNDGDKQAMIEKLDGMVDTYLKNATMSKDLGQQIYNIGAEFVGDMKGMWNDLASGLGLETTENLDGVMAEATHRLKQAGYSFKDITEEDRYQIDQAMSSRFGKHMASGQQFMANAVDVNGNPVNFNNATLSEFAQAYSNIETPQMRGFVLNNKNYVDYNIQEAIDSKSLAPLIQAADVMVKTQNNTILRGDKAKDYLDMRTKADVKSISAPILVTEGVDQNYTMGTSVTFDTDEGNFQVVIPTNSRNLKTVGLGLTELNRMERDISAGGVQTSQTPIYNLDGHPVYIEMFNGLGPNKEPVTYVKRFIKGENGEPRYFGDGTNATVQSIRDFRQTVEEKLVRSLNILSGGQQ